MPFPCQASALVCITPVPAQFHRLFLVGHLKAGRRRGQHLVTLVAKEVEWLATRLPDFYSQVSPHTSREEHCTLILLQTRFRVGLVPGWIE